jgi:thiol-disulfide isomerase/thioredoxin
MKNASTKILPVVFVILVLAWGVRYYIQKTVPPEMEFNGNELLTVDENAKLSINDFLGKVVIVSCFQTWCRDCAKETPVLNQLADNLADNDFQVIYITDEGNEKLAAFRARLASDKILFTVSRKSLAELGIHVYPTTFLLNKKGNVIKTKLEGHDWLKEEKLVRQLLAE